MEHLIEIGARREPFWDEYLIDAARTTAQLTLHRPQPREVVIEHDRPWEGDGCDFHCIVRDDDRYRLYYLGWETREPAATRHGPIVVCYAESTDGKTWTKPDLGICAFDGSTANNIILDGETAIFDNFSVFKDPNPACPAGERYKGVGLDGRDHWLWCFTSADGIHFRKAWQLTNRGAFDTLNTACWDRHAGRYLCYLRDFHDVPGDDWNAGIRDVRWMTSTDFKTWSEPVLLDFGDADDYPLYTNVVQPYYRADHLFVGFPSRYVEKKAWTANFAALAGAERRRERMQVQPRYGLTVTDCVFMSSRNGVSWKRWDEAFMTPGPEHELNWVYGDCYPALGMIETANDRPGLPNELSLYAFDNHWSGLPALLRRHVIRVDGFVSYRAPYRPATVVTKPFVFAGSVLSLNFSTSAAGWLVVELTDGQATLTSCEIFGDSLDRRIPFENGSVAALAGKPVRMKITLRDADVYSFKFDG